MSDKFDPAPFDKYSEASLEAIKADWAGSFDHLLEDRALDVSIRPLRERF